MNKMCEKIKEINIEGNVVPISWCDHVKKGEKQQTDLLAVSILADIVYWYRPSPIRSEDSGKIIGYKQKFKYDKLQKTYESYANLFGFPKRAVKAAIDNLIELKLITREFRTLKLSNDLKLSNVMYVEPIVENIVKITYKPKDKKCTTSLQNLVIPPYKKVQYLPTEFGGTNTKSNTENTANIKRVCAQIFSKKSLYTNYEIFLEKILDTPCLENFSAAHPPVSALEFVEITKKAIDITKTYKELPYTDAELIDWFASIKILIIDKKLKLFRIDKVLGDFSTLKPLEPRWVPDINKGSDLVEKFANIESAILRCQKKHFKRGPYREKVSDISIMPT